MRVAIHPQTLDIREFRPGMGYQSKGYVIVKGAEDLYMKKETWVLKLYQKVMGKPTKKLDLRDCTIIWPDIVIRAINNLAAAVEVDKAADPGPSDVVRDVVPIAPVKNARLSEGKANQGVGRGNHVNRIPDFRVCDVEIEYKVPSQCMVMALELRKLAKDLGKDIFTMREMQDTHCKQLNIGTKQDPMRIFRYYFWSLVRLGVLETLDGSYFNDRVAQQLAIRGRYSMWSSIDSTQCAGKTPEEIEAIKKAPAKERLYHGA